jgi:hypothetical protein
MAFSESFCTPSESTTLKTIWGLATRAGKPWARAASPFRYSGQHCMNVRAKSSIVAG